MNEALAILAGIGLAAACGLRVFMPLFIASLAVNTGVDGWGGFELQSILGEDFQWLGSTRVTIMLGVATALEIGSYYIPWLDNALDTVATPSAVLAGWFISGVMMPEFMGEGAIKWVAAAILGGGAAGLVQGGSVAARGTSTATTGGLGNFVIATLEWVGSVIASVLAVFVPLIAGVLAIVLAVFMLRKTIAFRRWLKQRAGGELAEESGRTG